MHVITLLRADNLAVGLGLDLGWANIDGLAGVDNSDAAILAVESDDLVLAVVGLVDLGDGKVDVCE